MDDMNRAAKTAMGTQSASETQKTKTARQKEVENLIKKQNKKNKPKRTLYTRVKEAVFGMPSYNEDNDYKAYASLSGALNMMFVTCVLLHAFYLIVFSFYQLPLMILFNLVSVLLYTTFVILLKHIKGSFLWCAYLTIFELYLHQICSVIYFGLPLGFQYLLIPTIFMAVFLRSDSKIVSFFRNLIVFLCSVTFIVATIYFNGHKPLYIFNENVSTLILIINCIVSFLSTAFFVGRIFYALDDMRSNLNNSVAEKTDKIDRLQQKIIISFADIIEARDDNTGKHVKRTSGYVEALMKELKRKGLYADTIDEQYMHYVMMSAPLHDIGKITISDTILLKPGKLTKEEFDIIKKHTVNGKKIIERSMGDIEDERFLKIAKAVALYHHERWDGSGYPYGLKGKDIPLCARVMSIADYFDAIVTKRSYKEAMPTSVAFEDIRSLRGTKFDPVLVDAFLNIQEEIEHIAENA